MKSSTLTWITAVTLFAALALPVPLAAQEQQEHGKERHRYRFVDIGTFGGPASYINGAMRLGAPNQINRRGTTVGSSATTIPSPPDSNLGICGGLDGIVPFVFHAFEWQNGVATDLGALAGGDICSEATSINSKGEIVGHSENGVIDPVLGVREIRAVLWKHGKIRDLGTFGGSGSLVGSINDRGQVAGATLNATPDPFSLLYFVLAGSSNGTQTRAFLWENGHMRDLQTLGGPDAQAFFVNEHGQVIGLSYTDSIPNPTTKVPRADPFLWTKDGGMTDLGTLGGTFGSPTGLNNRGQVIGNSSLATDPGACIGVGNTANCHPFLWDQGKLIDLFTSAIGGNPITADALNDAGEIVGFAAFPNGAFDAYLWKDGVVTDLGTLAGDCFSEAFAINSRGQVVGQSFSCVSNTVRTFLWENGSMIDLNTFVPPGSGVQLVEAFALNDRGDIGGIGDPPGCANLNDAACGHAFLLIPCDRDHSATEGCLDEGESTDVATQRSTTPVSRPTDATQTALTPGMLAVLRSRFARRNHNPGLGPPRF